MGCHSRGQQRADDRWSSHSISISSETRPSQLSSTNKASLAAWDATNCGKHTIVLSVPKCSSPDSVRIRRHTPKRSSHRTRQVNVSPHTHKRINLHASNICHISTKCLLAMQIAQGVCLWTECVHMYIYIYMKNTQRHPLVARLDARDLCVDHKFNWWTIVCN